MHLLSVFSLRNRALIALVTVVVGIFGSIALSTLRQELIPSLTLPQVVIVTNYPGAAPEVVNEDVSTPIETAIQGITGLEATTATSSTDLSTVSASFEFGTQLTAAEQNVTLAVNRISSQLPDGVDPVVITGSFDDLPVIQIAATSDELDPIALSTALSDSAIPDIQALDGVREADLLGTTVQRVTITPDATALAEAGASNQTIRDALDANGALLPAGSITENDQTLTVQAGQRLGSADDIGALPLLGATSADDSVVNIADVADVVVEDDPVTGISRVNGEPALTISVTTTPDGNTVAVSNAVADLLPELAETIGGATEFTVVFDQAPFIEESIEALALEGSLGLVFAVIVILVFLLSVRSTLVTAVSIPVSILITFIGMLASGYTLNIITLGALTIAIGRVVDDSIVVIENIRRHLTLGQPKLEAIQTGVREVAAAVTASTAANAAVFLPLALVGDITGELFRPFALTVTIALAASVFVALTIVPVLAYWFLKVPESAPTHTAQAGTDASGAAVTGGELADGDTVRPVDQQGRPLRPRRAPDGFGAESAERPTRLQRGYLPVIRWTIRKPIVTLLSAVLVLGGTVALTPLLEANFIGDTGENTLTVTQSLPLGASLDAQDAAASEVESVLLDLDGVETVQLSLGQSGGSILQAFTGGGDINFSLTTDPDADQVALQAEVRDALAELDGVGEVSLAAAGAGFASSDIEIEISGAGQGDLGTATDRVLTAVRALDVTAEASSNLAEELPFIAVAVDRAAAAQVGLSELAVGGIVAEAKLPAAIGSVVIDDTTLSIYIANENEPVTLQELRDFVIPTAAGPLPLTDVATVEEVDGPASITTVRGVRTSTVTVTPSVQDIAAASAAVADAVDELELPAGVTSELGGVTAQQADAFRQLGLAMLVAILIVYVIMVATFKSLRQPLLLLVSIPFAATGAILLQLATGIPLGVPSLIGVLLLIGVVVTNSIVLVDLINQYRVRGLSARDAVVEGSSRRLRPILMTAAATIFALVPLATGVTGSGGGFISQPLAIVVIGGLVSSTALTLVVLPVLYYLVEGARERREERRAARMIEAEQTAESPGM